MLIFYQQRVENIDVSPSVIPLLGCTDTYGEIGYIGTQLLCSFSEQEVS
jgi:hypothetical protein